MKLGNEHRVSAALRVVDMLKGKGKKLAEEAALYKAAVEFLKKLLA